MKTDEYDEALKMYRGAMKAVEQKRDALHHAELVVAVASALLDDLESELARTAVSGLAPR